MKEMPGIILKLIFEFENSIKKFLKKFSQQEYLFGAVLKYLLEISMKEFILH